MDIEVENLGKNIKLGVNILEKNISEGKLHYGKDDFIDFSQLYLSKPIVKAC